MEAKFTVSGELISHAGVDLFVTYLQVYCCPEQILWACPGNVSIGGARLLMNLNITTKLQFIMLSSVPSYSNHNDTRDVVKRKPKISREIIHT